MKIKITMIMLLWLGWALCAGPVSITPMRFYRAVFDTANFTELWELRFPDTTYLVQCANLKIRLLPSEEDSVSSWVFDQTEPKSERHMIHYNHPARLEIEIKGKKYYIDLRETEFLPLMPR